ncbi:hypothetical protein [Aeromonas hydrophila]|uniref:hypothetical protein n=1 Tax=Aeromonas hydrophila TaxID=644 RepID=UPI001F369C27|nr:hypothetical protein [Aeromonas hydrophila]
MAEIVDAFSLSAREIEAFLDTLFAILHSTSESSIDIIYLSALIVMHSRNPLAYNIIRDGGKLLDIEVDSFNSDVDNVFSFKNKIKLPMDVSYWSCSSSARNEKVVWQVNDFYSYVLQVNKILDGYSSSEDNHNVRRMNDLTIIKSGIRSDNQGKYYKACLKSKGLGNSDYIELVELSTLLL